MAKDHPRMRGVHVIIGWLFAMVQGSSPHARGPLKEGPPIAISSRIIPACAGSTSLTYSGSLSH